MLIRKHCKLQTHLCLSAENIKEVQYLCVCAVEHIQQNLLWYKYTGNCVFINDVHNKNNEFVTYSSVLFSTML